MEFLYNSEVKGRIQKMVQVNLKRSYGVIKQKEFESNQNKYQSFQIRRYNINRISFEKVMKHKQTPKITVVIRKRPLNKKETSKGETDIVKIQNRESVVVSEYKQKVDLTKYIEETTFNFDHAFDQQSTNEQIYERTIRPLIDSAFEGAKISCFAYGQTGSGKTFTMKGDMGRNVPGLYFLAAKQIFNYLEHPQFQRLNIFVSFYEIYCGKLFDLLTNRTELKIRQDKHANINIIGLEEKPIYSANEFLDIIEEGSALRITSQNATNADSSRSHAIMQIHLKDGKKTFTKVSFIDLAGNERGADHMDQNKQTKIDGAEINKSLLALKECIRALDQGKGHTPFRGSKLTMVLKDSFVGFCKTVMIGNVSPNVSSSQNTMNTLRYADRVKQLKKGGESLSKQQLQAKELMLPRAANKNTVKVTIDREDDAQDIRNKLEIAKKKAVVEPQRMDIEASKEKEPVTLERRGLTIKDTINGKKTETPATNFRVQEKKTPSTNKHDMSVSKPQIRANNENMSLENGNGSKKNLLLNGPLNQKNVNLKKIDQNNINLTNQDGKHKPMSAKPIINPISNMQLEQLNRHHFDVMNSLHSEFSKFKENHSKSVKEETIIIRDEMIKLGQLSEVDQWNNDASNYLDLVEKSIQEKIRLIQNLHAEVQLLRKKKNEAEDISRVLQEQKMQQQTSGTKHHKPSPMQIQFTKGHNFTTSNNSTNPSKYIYHSIQPQNNQQYSQINMNQNNEPQPYSRSNQYHYTYSNTNPSTQQGNGYIGYNAHSSHNIGGYQFSQYHLKNNYVPQYSNHDEQLLEDLPGDQNMQRLF